MGSGIRFDVAPEDNDGLFSIITIRIPTDKVQTASFEDTEAEIALMRFNLGGAEQICLAFQHEDLAKSLYEIREKIRAVTPGQELEPD